jgi:molybdopterin/thiamine biosynthesis adenylyltransferase
MDIAEFLKQSKNGLDSKPVIFDLSQKSARVEFQKLVDTEKVQHVSDDYLEQLKELVQVENPSKVYTPEFAGLFENYIKNIETQMPLWQHGRWAYFSWNSTVVHILEEAAFQKVRTARNKNLINADEQEKYYNAIIGIAGQSVGHAVTLAIVLQGGGKHWRIADNDALALSNTNRIRVGVENLGLPKVVMTARQIYQTNPYATVELFGDGLAMGNIEKFFAGPPKLDIVIDEIDNLAVKYLIRERAKKHKLAVVMAADNGDNAVIDVERYDLDPNTPFFHDRMGKVSYEMLAGLDKFGIGKMITKHVGPENVTERMQQSLLEMGKTVVSWPQLGGAALINGAAVAYCVRKILNKQPLESNRALISLDEKLIPNYNSLEEQAKRDSVASTFRKIFGL